MRAPLRSPSHRIPSACRARPLQEGCPSMSTTSQLRSVRVAGCHTQSRSSRQCRRVALRSPAVSLSISGGVAIAATFVVPGKQSKSLSTLWIANPVYDPAEKQQFALWMVASEDLTSGCDPCGVGRFRMRWPDGIFFSVQRRMASARSFNMFPSMLQMRLIN